MATGGFAPRKVRVASRRVSYGRVAGPNQELKFLDVDIAGNFDVAGNRIVTLNTIVQGTGESERIGRKCTLKSIQWRSALTLADTDTAATASSLGRLIVYIDKQTNGAQAAILDVLETASVFAYRNLSNTQRFTVLADHTFTMTSSAAAEVPGNDYGSVKRQYSFYKKVNIPLEFSGTTGVIAELRSNNLACLFISTDNDRISIDGNLRLRFSDI